MSLRECLAPPTSCGLSITAGTLFSVDDITKGGGSPTSCGLSITAGTLFSVDDITKGGVFNNEVKCAGYTHLTLYILG